VFIYANIAQNEGPSPQKLKLLYFLMETHVPELKNCKTPYERLLVLSKRFNYISLIYLHSYIIDHKIYYYNIFNPSLPPSNIIMCMFCFSRINAFSVKTITRNNLILYGACFSCNHKTLCKNCLHPTKFCKAVKITTALSLHNYKHAFIPRDIINIIISYL
jgi:hypothetical protein